ncbi:DUF624 domain-containing protein [Robertmurraya yapensis]|uniref:DUF624 domain-containing protein n=1 Tax=Bacillus yapensis TaxID=2492960 RepID=A0A3S0IKF6_9BACI|nr:DUF624 domain-containing protein [Bacillus yapensis]RTR36175.1 DUF624 domain-containing protein [Bacillus yapensis]TKT05678.1 DUF624 domain-containing protein [Bacillus yapensis]
MNKMSSVIYNILNWITRFAYLQLVWVLFTLVGGFLFGIFPATVAMYAIIRAWLRGDTEIAIFQSFWKFYKNDFLKSNSLGVFLLLVGAIIGLDLYYIQQTSDTLLSWTSAPLFAFMILFLLFVFYLFPAFVHYDLNNFSIMKNAFFIMLIHPLHSLLMLLGLASIAIIMYIIPALAFIFGASTVSFITMWLSLHAFHHVSKKG